MKVNIADYIKLKDDPQWRFFNRQLRETAASHDTLEVLNPLLYHQLVKKILLKRNAN
jgi:hypothetical protein